MAQDEAAGDQQLLSAGVNDRNVEDFLGLIEQRIDDLIQVSYVLQMLYCVTVQSLCIVVVRTLSSSLFNVLRGKRESKKY